MNFCSREETELSSYNFRVVFARGFDLRCLIFFAGD
jgi:hypothetical protein